MAYIANTAFEVKVHNGIYDGLQNVAGKFGTMSGGTFTPDVCSAGFFCTQDSLIPSEGYKNLTNPILNGNTWYFVEATSGQVDGLPGDRTGIYASNTYNVHQVVSANGDMKFNLGANTLGLAIPADEFGDFTELKVGEQYKFGAGNFASVPTVGQYVEIANGLFTASSSTAPSTAGTVYGQVLRTEAFNEGASFWGDGYIVKIFRA
jgi:hypothetical protein